MPAVARYVSAPPPSATATSWVRQAAPVLAGGDGVYRLDDPAWPAEYRLDEASRALVERCERTIEAGELGDASAVLPLLARLIRRGVIISSHEQ